MVRMRESQPEQLAGAGMAGRGPTDIGTSRVTSEGRWRGRGNLTSGLAAVLAAVLLPPAPALADVDASAFAARWGAWGEIGGTWGSEGASHGEIVLFAPLGQTPDGLVFADIRGKIYESAIVEGNFALGGRRMLPSGWNLGGWGALDVRRTASDNLFGQASGGIEALSEHFDLRLNGYLPLTGPQTAGPGMADVILDGSNIFMVGGQEVPLAGVDAEVGARLPFAGNAGHVGVYGGGFWFGSPHAGEAIAGGKARVELALNDIAGAGSRFSAGYEFTHDNVRGDRHLVGARLRIPLGPAPPAASTMPAQWLRMADRIERDVDIVIGGSKEAVEDALTEVDFDQVAYVEDGGSITDTSTNSGDNTLILVNGTVSGAQELQGNQTLQGGGSTIAVRGLTSGTVADFMAPGDTPTLDTPGDASNLTFLGSNAHVAGLSILGAGRDSGLLDNVGILGGSDKSNIVIEQVQVADVGSTGIIFRDNNSEVTIIGVEIGPAGAGILFSSGNSNLTIADAIIDDVVNGIFFGVENSDATVVNTRISNAAQAGIIINSSNSNVTIADTHISDAFTEGIRLLDGNRNVVITTSTITDIDLRAIHLFDGDNELTVTDTTIANTGAGFSIRGANNSLTIADTKVENAALALQVDFVNFESEATVAMNRTVFTGNFLTVILIADESNTLSGGSNNAANATSSIFCDAPPQANGSFFAFDDTGSGNPGTCP